MLPAMLRALGIALVMISAACAGCEKSASNQHKTEATTANKDEVINVPGGTDRGAVTGPGQITGGSAAPNVQTTGAPDQMGAPADDPRFHLQPEEGTLTVDKAEGKAGAQAKGAVK